MELIGKALAFQAVVALNALTFQNPDKVDTLYDKKGQVTFYAYQSTFLTGTVIDAGLYKFKIVGTIGDIRDGGGPTLTNTFLIAKDCLTPRTSYPGTRGD